VLHSQHENSVDSARVSLERDVFLRTLIRELAGTLQDVVGLEEASGFISVVGQRMGTQINEDYKAALSVSKLNRSQVADVLVDLKRRIQGEFFIIEETDDKIVLGNHGAEVLPFYARTGNLDCLGLIVSQRLPVAKRPLTFPRFLRSSSWNRTTGGGWLWQLERTRRVGCRLTFLASGRSPTGTVGAPSQTLPLADDR
jgi:hypothetical protein